MASHAGMTSEEFEKLVKDWMATATHPKTGKHYNEMIYQPMVELLQYLRADQFKTFIVSGGGVDFMREAISKVYGIPYEQIIGSSVKYHYIDDTSSGNSTIFREPELNSFDNNEVKPENIQLHIGKVPIIAVGNSDGDLQMLRFADNNNKDGKSLEIIVHHDDAIREYSYDRGAEQILKEADKNSCNIVSMKNDFLNIYSRKNLTTLN